MSEDKDDIPIVDWLRARGGVMSERTHIDRAIAQARRDTLREVVALIHREVNVHERYPSGSFVNAEMLRLMRTLEEMAREK